MLTARLVKDQRPSLTSLPEDIISHIFVATVQGAPPRAIVAPLDFSSSTVSHLSRTRLALLTSHLSRPLRMLSLQTPSLWTSVHERMHPSLLALFIERSGDCGLRVDLALDTHLPPGLPAPNAERAAVNVGVLCARAERWEELVLQADLPKMVRDRAGGGALGLGLGLAFPDSMVHVHATGTVVYFPRLKTFYVKDGFNFVSPSSVSLSSWCMPNLRVFSAISFFPTSLPSPLPVEKPANVSTSANSLSSLTISPHFASSPEAGEPKLLTLLSHIRISSSLRHLTLVLDLYGANSLSSDIRDFAHTPPIVLPHLQSFEFRVTENTTQCIALFRKLIMPRLSSMKARADGDALLRDMLVHLSKASPEVAELDLGLRNFTFRDDGPWAPAPFLTHLPPSVRQLRISKTVFTPKWTQTNAGTLPADSALQRLTLDNVIFHDASSMTGFVSALKNSAVWDKIERLEFIDSGVAPVAQRNGSLGNSEGVPPVDLLASTFGKDLLSKVTFRIRSTNGPETMRLFPRERVPVWALPCADMHQLLKPLQMGNF